MRRNVVDVMGVKCGKCGVHNDGVASNGTIRCKRCGRFGEEPKEYCAEHDVHYKDLYPEDNHCPMCREERRIRDMRQHEATRDPQMEPW